MNILIYNYENPILKTLYNLYKLSEYNTNFSKINDTEKTVVEIIKKNNISHIIYTDVIYDIEECQSNSNSIEINKSSAKKIYNIAQKYNINVIYISSYEIYGDINLSSYSEIDSYNPINKLGLSQQNSELLFHKNNNSIILRTSWVFGTDTCYIKQIISNANTPLFFSNTKVINPTPVSLIFESINKLIASNKYGIFNCASIDYCSKIDFTKFIFDIIGIQKEILPFPKYVKERLVKSANFSAIDSSLLSQTLNLKNKDWQSHVIDYLQSEFV